MRVCTMDGSKSLLFPFIDLAPNQKDKIKTKFMHEAFLLSEMSFLLSEMSFLCLLV